MIPSDKKYTPNIDQNSAPHQFLCPISGSVMIDPVITMDGYSYEKQSLQKWFQKSSLSPLTGIKIQKRMVENRALKQSIMYHNLRDVKACQNAQKLLQSSYSYLQTICPKLINDIGLLDNDRIVELITENQSFRKLLQNIRSLLQQIENKIQNNGCNSCLKTKEGCKNIKKLIKSNEYIMNKSVIYQKINVDPVQLKYLPLSCQILKDIDFQLTDKDYLTIKQLKSYGIEKLPLQTLIKKIKIQNNIPQQYFVQLWRTNLSIPQFHRSIKSQLGIQSCSYVQKIKEVGKKVTDLKLRLQDLKLKPQQYLIFEHGSIGPPKQQFVFRGEEVKCRYCYKLKPEKFKCACDGVSYCSQECGQKDKEYHKKQCSYIKIVPISS